MRPEKLGRYQIIEEIGRGAMGIVYLAYDPRIKRNIAVKAFNIEQMVEPSEREEFKLRFQREAQLAGNLSHPNIIAIHDVGEEEEISFIAMEFVEGESLAELIAKNYRFSIEEIADIFSQLCQGMSYAHQQGIIHRDLKPSNILLRKDGLVKIADFGIARALGATITASHKTLGTPAYMSPEQITGGRIDLRSDIFSLGIILYQMLTGERPFAGEITSTIIYRIINEDPIPPRKISLQVPPGFNHIVLKALSKDPTERYQSCGELLADIKNYKRIKPPETLPTLPLGEDKTSRALEVAKGKPGRKSWWLIAAVFIILAIAIYLFYEFKYKKRGGGEAVYSQDRLEQRVEAGREAAATISDVSSEQTVPAKDKSIPSGSIEKKEVIESSEKTPSTFAAKTLETKPSSTEEQKRYTTPADAQTDSSLIISFGPMPPGKYILKIDGKKAQEENFVSLTFLNQVQKNNAKLFFALRRKALELGKLHRYRNIYRKRIPIIAGNHTISLSLILFIPSIVSTAEDSKEHVVKTLELERIISGHFVKGQSEILVLRREKGDISLFWQNSKQ
jgi:serine/threonine protein kinase